jgi:hypothetical protein
MRNSWECKLIQSIDFGKHQAQSLTKILLRVWVVLSYVGNDCKWLCSISILFAGTSDPVANCLPESSLTSGGSSQRLESQRLELFSKYFGRARRFEPLIRGSNLSRLFFLSIVAHLNKQNHQNWSKNDNKRP